MALLIVTLLLAWVLASVGAGLVLGRVLARRNVEGVRAAAWDGGFSHALGLAHHTVAIYPKPWITLGEERGWDMAREQLRIALADLIEPDPAIDPPTDPEHKEAAA